MQARRPRRQELVQARAFGEADDQRAKRRAQHERQVRVFLVDALVAHVAVAAHDGPRARVDPGGLDVGDDAVDRQRVLGRHFDERAERRRRVELARLRQKLGRRRLDDLADQTLTWRSPWATPVAVLRTLIRCAPACG